MTYSYGSFRTAILVISILASLIAQLIPWRAVSGTDLTVQAATCLNPPLGLVSWWSGEGGALDNVGQNHGTLHGNVTFPAGRIGQAFYFDGGAGYLRAGNPPNLQMTSAVTLETWIKPADFPEGHRAAVIGKWGQGASVDSYSMFLKKLNGQIVLTGAIGDGVRSDAGFLGGSIPADTWSHIAMTYDSGSGNNLLYIDGQLTGSRLLSGSIFTSDHAVQIGREDSVTGHQYAGFIDEPAIYNRALAGNEIRALANASGGKCQSSSPPGDPPPDPAPAPAPESPPVPVLLVPGAMGSEMGYDRDGSFARLWPGVEHPWDDDVMDLRRLPDGSEVKQGRKRPGQVVEKVAVTDIYDSFLQRLKADRPVYTLPYDWRETVPVSAQRLADKIASIRNETQAQQLDIVAHSLGGLVAMEYLRSSTAAETPHRIRNLITVGTPFVGTPEALRTLRYGRGLRGLGQIILGNYESKRIAHNAPSAYQMLPSRAYFSALPNSYGQPRYVLDSQDNDWNRQTQVLTFDDTQAFLKNGLEQLYPLEAEDYQTTASGSPRLVLHNQLIDDGASFHSLLDEFTQNLPADVAVHTIAGWGRPTARVYEDRVHYNGGILPPVPEHSVNVIKDLSGDQTVPWWSAAYPRATRKYFVDLRNRVEHFKMLADSDIQNLVIDIVNNDGTAAVPGVTLSPPSPAETAPASWQVEVFSPVDMQLTDESGNRTGYDQGYLEQVPGSSYELPEETGAENLSFPLQDGLVLHLHGAGEGTFDLKIRETRGDETVRTITYRNVRVTAQSLATITPQWDEAEPLLKLDYNGDGLVDRQILPAQRFSGSEPTEALVDVLPGSTTNSFKLDSKGIITTALITTPQFDALSVDPLSLRFGPGQTQEIHRKGHFEDANGDGKVDLVLHFSVSASELQASDTTACLTGRVKSGAMFQGCDAITVKLEK